MSAPLTHYTHAGNADVAYQVIGDGPIDLLYHHGMCHLDLQWDVAPEAAFNERLASFSRLILFDRRGSGASERRADGVFPTAEEWSEDVLAVLDAAGSERTAIFAEAEAGPTAIRFAARHPDRVTAMVLGNTWPRFAQAPDYSAGIDSDQIEPLVAGVQSLWGTPDLMRAQFPLLADDADVIEPLARLLRAAATPAMAAALYRHIWTELDVRDDLTSLAVPTLVLRNERARAAADYLADHIPAARVSDVDNDEVLFYAGDYEPVIAEVAEFLTGQRPEATPTRALTTVMFTDIVDSTGRAAGLGDTAWRKLLARHDDRTRRHVGAHDGRVVKSMGDGALATFDDPEQAVAAAQALITDLRGDGVELRVGLHFGKVEILGDDVAGVGVHLAARISDLAQPGEILVSRTVPDLLLGSDLTFADRGTHELKGVPDPWQVLAVTSG